MPTGRTTAATSIFEDTSQDGPARHRVPISGGEREEVVNFKDVRRPLVTAGEKGSGRTPDDSPPIMHDVSSREIYALEMQRP